MKCKNCGAELNNGKCEYCGSFFLENRKYLFIKGDTSKDINSEMRKVRIAETMPILLNCGINSERAIKSVGLFAESDRTYGTVDVTCLGDSEPHYIEGV